MISRRFILATFAALVACAAPPPSEGGSSEQGVAAKGVCATLDYGHTRPNADYFLTFDADDRALEFARAWMTVVRRPTPLAVSNDARLRRLISEVYASFQQVYPRETAGMSAPPRLIVVDAKDINAFAGYDDRPEVDRAPWLFFVHEAILSAPLSDNQLRGLFAHELAHLVLRNVLPETRRRIRVHYRVDQGEDGILGASQVDDPAVGRKVEEIRRLGAEVGRFTDLGPLPLGVFETTRYETMLRVLAPRAADSPAPEACQRGEQQLREVAQSYASRIDPNTFRLRASTAERAAIASDAEAAAASYRACFSHVKMSLFELKLRASFAELPIADADARVAKALDPSSPEHAAEAAALLQDPTERDLERRSATEPLVDLVLEGAAALHARLEALTAEPSTRIDSLRVFDMEEDADDAAVRVLSAMGDDPLGNARFVVGLLKAPAREECERSVAAGETPFYGAFVDPHDATCYRYYHAVQFSKTLAQCATGAARPGATNKR